MNLKRKIYGEMLEWKAGSNGTTALLIVGARRVGKSYICESFARNEKHSGADAEV
jgi:predicted AAA+ superfamily ATPase